LKKTAKTQVQLRFLSSILAVLGSVAVGALLYAQSCKAKVRKRG
jgi:hypothetical protein